MKNTIPILCKNANGKVIYLVYWLIFCCPTSPCSVSSSNDGITCVKSWRMIDALMYGANPTAMIEKLSNEPHNNITKYPNPDVSNVLLTNCVICTNGTGINTRSLYTNNAPSVNNSLFLIFLFVNNSLMICVNPDIIISVMIKKENHRDDDYSSVSVVAFGAVPPALFIFLIADAENFSIPSNVSFLENSPLPSIFTGVSVLLIYPPFLSVSFETILSIASSVWRSARFMIAYSVTSL